MNNENICKVFIFSIDYCYCILVEYIIWNSEFWINFFCEYDIGNDKIGKGNSKYGEYNVIVFVREVEVGSYFIWFGVGDIVMVEGVEEIISWYWLLVWM